MNKFDEPLIDRLENANRLQAEEIAELREELAAASGWKDDAMMYCKNADYWKQRAEAAEAPIQVNGRVSMTPRQYIEFLEGKLKAASEPIAEVCLDYNMRHECYHSDGYRNIIEWISQSGKNERLIPAGTKLYAHPPVPANAHPDDAAVDAFALRMKSKLAVARSEGRGGWDDNSVCTAGDLSCMLRQHVVKGDPVDVANFCMMLSMRGEAIEQEEPPAPADVQGLQMCNALQAQSISMLSSELNAAEKRIAELGRKLAEQQAALKLAAEAFERTASEYRTGYLKGGSVLVSDMRVEAWNAVLNFGAEELNTLLAKAREEGRKEGLSNTDYVVPAYPTLEMLDAICPEGGASYPTLFVRYQKMLAAAPEVKP